MEAGDGEGAVKYVYCMSGVLRDERRAWRLEVMETVEFGLMIRMLIVILAVGVEQGLKQWGGSGSGLSRTCKGKLWGK